MTSLGKKFLPLFVFLFAFFLSVIFHAGELRDIWLFFSRHDDIHDGLQGNFVSKSKHYEHSTMMIVLYQSNER